MKLKISYKNGDSFHNFKESEINLAPTYKFDIHTDTYDTSKKKRKPAWCDRIFFKINETECEVKEYNSMNEFKISDHKPVFGLYYINVIFKEILNFLFCMKDFITGS